MSWGGVEDVVILLLPHLKKYFSFRLSLLFISSVTESGFSLGRLWGMLNGRRRGEDVINPPQIFTAFSSSCSAVFRGGPGEQGQRGGHEPDSGGQGPAPQSQLERRLPHRQRRSHRTLHHPHQPHHQRGHADSGQGKRSTGRGLCGPQPPPHSSSTCICSTGFPPAGRLRDEPGLHADGGGLQPGPPGQRHPVLATVHRRRHHIRPGRERAARLPRQPQSDPLRGGRASGDHSDRLRCSGPRPLHPSDSQVHLRHG